MPVDFCVVAESVYGVLREFLLKAKVPNYHRHVGADRREHIHKQIHKDLEHGKTFDYMCTSLPKRSPTQK